MADCGEGSWAPDPPIPAHLPAPCRPPISHSPLLLDFCMQPPSWRKHTETCGSGSKNDHAAAMLLLGYVKEAVNSQVSEVHVHLSWQFHRQHMF